MADIFEALKWFAVFEAIFFAGLGVAWKVLPFLPARGVYFARPIALLCIGFLTWQGSVIEIVPNGWASWWIFTGVLCLFTCWVFLRNRKSLVSVIRNNLGGIITSEVLFVALFASLVLFKYFDPAISGTEKPMEFMLLNTSWHTVSGSPQDAWLSGNPVSYYYFGYWLFAGVANMSAVVPAYAFNLAIAAIAGMAASASFGLVFALAKSSGGKLLGGRKVSNTAAITAGLLGVVALMLTASFGGWWEFGANFGIGPQSFYDWLGIEGITLSTATPTFLPQDFWWWWRISRVINTFDPSGVSLDTTIQEFPAFSFVLGDLHPHLISIPFLILNFGIALNLWRSPGAWNLQWFRRNKASGIFIGFAIGAQGFLNLPDLPFILALLFATATLKNYTANPNRHLISTAIRSLVPVLILALVGALAFWAFYPPFGSSDGQLTVPFLGITRYTTQFIHFFTVWGVFLIVLAPGAVILAALFIRRSLSNRAAVVSTTSRRPWLLFALLLLIPLIPWLVFNLFGNLNWNPTQGASLFGSANSLLTTQVSGEPSDIAFRLITPLFIAALLAVLWFAVFPTSDFRRVLSNFRMPLILLAVAFYVLYAVEFLFALDSFGTRLNSVFKTYYQTWMAISLVSAYFSVLLLRRLFSSGALAKITGFAWSAFLLLILVAPLYYTAAAFTSKALDGASEPTLNGISHIEATSPADYEAILWINEKVAPDMTLVEASGASYTEFGILSAYTGRPTLLGWVGHELQWRGVEPEFAERARALRTLYTETSPNPVSEVVLRYKVDYVVVSCRERAQYAIPGQAAVTAPEMTEKVFESKERCVAGEQSDTVKIYRVLENERG